MTDLREYARNAAARAGIDPAYFERQIDQESGFNPQAYNSQSGASGIAQIVERWHPGVNVWDPESSLDYAANLMASHLKTFKSMPKALAAYNWGPGNVGGYTRADGSVVPPWDGRRETLPAETRRYLDVILGPGWELQARRVAYDRDYPAIAQNDDWSCAPTSATWALRSVGRAPQENWIEPTMLAEGVVTREHGLMDASGAGLAAFLNRHYGEFGFHASHEPIATFNALASEAGRYPLLIGGRAWGHWSGLRGYNPATDALLLANPSDGWKSIGQAMTRADFDRLGPFSLVRLTHPDLMTNEPGPTTPPGPSDPPAPPGQPDLAARVAILERENAELISRLGYLTGDVAEALQAAVNTLKEHRP